MKTVRLLVVDDESMVRQGLAGLLSLEPDFEIVGSAANGAAALEVAARTQPDVVLMDIQMPVMNGLEATPLLLQQQPGVRVLMLTTFDEDDFVVQAMKLGAHGYLLKDCGSKQLSAAVRLTMNGFTTLARPAMQTIVQHSMEPEQSALLRKLTAREQEVLACLGEGLTNTQISQRLLITEKTVRDHVSNILAELGLRDRTQAALWARKI